MLYRIYVVHSRDVQLNYIMDLYQPLQTEFSEHEIIVPHPDEAEKNSPIDSREIIPTCHLMIAEVSYPSTGLGMELAWADAAKTPVLCIYKAGCMPSSSVTNLFSNFVSYEDKNDMKQKILAWISAHHFILESSQKIPTRFSIK